MSRSRSRSRSGRRPVDLPEEQRGERDRLTARLDEVGIADGHRLGNRLRRAASATDLQSIAGALDDAATRLARRADSVPEIVFPDQLPVSERRDEIAAAIRDHQVVVVAGETGSGKTTQLPKICLAMGRGVRGMIGHTQPRRLAARTVADRIAEEVGSPLGDLVGYSVRFDDHVGPGTCVKLMTDGILLSEIRRDRLLRAYDTIIIDEAHERSLNIDFLLGYLARLLPRRPDLKVIITSATIDPERFARHFRSRSGEPAPIVEVSGRTYPVEIRYRPTQVLSDDRLVDLDPLDALADAVTELLACGDGDVLVFLSGEREIRDAEEVLRGRKLPRTQIFPLYARLTTAEQNRAFRSHPGRRVVLATNIAETSVTVPGIRYVVDTGLARISRYSVRTKVRRLPIEPISRASADQRAGRCGRVADGICIRLYSEQDYLVRPRFTDPEILRTDLASVILAMADLDLGAVEDFPFVDPPDPRAIRDGRALLTELGAITVGDDSRPHLTTRGREMAALPLDPRMSRMLVEAHHSSVLHQVLVVVAGLTVQDVRERPAEHRERADGLHRRFADKTSDFLGLLNLWRYLTEQRRELSGSAFRRMCRDEYLHWLRIREWQDLVSQLTSICRENGWDPSPGHADDDALHRALLTGLLSNVGMRVEDSREFLGARGIRFQVFPGSDLARRPPRWVMAAELVETSRLWGRDVARVDPAWIEAAAAHLVRRQYSEPHWSAAEGTAMAYEKVTLFGLPVVTGRRVLLSRVDPELAHEMFVRHGIVEGGWRTSIPVLVDNAREVAEAREWETRSRRAGLVLDDEALVAFYLGRIPAEVVSGRHLESWWRREGRDSGRADDLRLGRDDLVVGERAPDASQFPPAWRQGELTFPLEYTFDPAAETDGIAVRIPLAQLPAVKASGFEWLVPGMRTELYTALLRTLPKYLRRECSPPADYAALLAQDLRPRSAPLTAALAAALSARIGSGVEASDFRPEALPDHLRMRFEITDGDRVVATGDDLAVLRRELSERARHRLAGSLVPDDGPFAGWTDSGIGDLPESVTDLVDGVSVTVYPALAVRDDGVHRIGCATPAERRTAQTTALLALLRDLGPSAASVARGRSVRERLALTQYPHGGLEALVEDATLAAVAAVIAEAGGPVLTVAGYERLRATARDRVPGAVTRRMTTALPALSTHQEVLRVLEQVDARLAPAAAAGMDFLIGRGFLARHPESRIGQLERHLRAALTRVCMARDEPGRFSELNGRLTGITERVDEAERALAGRAGGRRSARSLQWMLAELRVSVFAQSLGTDGPISVERIDRAVTAALGGARI